MTDKTRKIVYNSKSIGGILGKFATNFQFKLLSFYKDKQIVDLIKEIKKEVDFAFYPYEAFMIYSIVKTQVSIEGNLAEVGVYQGMFAEHGNFTVEVYSKNSTVKLIVHSNYLFISFR